MLLFEISVPPRLNEAARKRFVFVITDLLDLRLSF